jgi:hypothetical protein
VEKPGTPGLWPRPRRHGICAAHRNLPEPVGHDVQWVWCVCPCRWHDSCDGILGADAVRQSCSLHRHHQHVVVVVVVVPNGRPDDCIKPCPPSWCGCGPPLCYFDRRIRLAAARPDGGDCRRGCGGACGGSCGDPCGAGGGGRRRRRRLPRPLPRTPPPPPPPRSSFSTTLSTPRPSVSNQCSR